MKADSTCARCGTVLVAALAEGLCPMCLGRLVATELEPLLQAADGPGEEAADVPDLWVDPAPPQGTLFGDYEIIEEIAHGGMGVVHKARQVSLDRWVAVKMIRADRLAEEQEVRRFYTEAQAAAKLQHPNIVAIHEVGDVDGQHFYSMDYVAGCSLSQIAREPLSPRKAAGYVEQITGAIHYAHVQGVLHRDLKPSNVLIDANDQVRVTDFGLAKLLQSDSELTISGTVMGSPSYMPPEQASGQTDAVGVRSDVYSLGAILYDLLCGRPPFRAETALETLRQVVEEVPAPPHVLNPKVPRDLETICLKCLEKDPARRYPTAGELAAELQRFLRREPIQARPVSWPEKLWRWCRRNPALATALGAAAGIFFVGFTASVWQWRRAEARAFDALQNLYAADMNLSQQAIRQNNFGYALNKLRAYWPRPGERDLRGWEWRYLWNLCRNDEVFTLSGHGGAVVAVALSPDGKRLASAGSDAAVRLWSVATRETLATVTGIEYRAGQIAVAFAPKTSALAVVDRQQVVLRDGENGRVLREFRPDPPSRLFSVAFLPDGNQLIASSDHGLHMWNVTAETNRSTLVRGSSACAQFALSPNGKWLAGLFFRSEVQVWNLITRERLWKRSFGEDQVESLALSDTGLLAVGDRDGNLRLLDSHSGRDVKAWKGHGSAVYALAFAPDALSLATGGSDQVIHLWAVTNQQALVTYQGHVSEVWSVAFSANGQWLASGGKDGAVKYWDTHRRAPSNELPGSYYPLWFSGDGQTLVSFTPGRDLQFWDVPSRHLVRTLPPPTNVVVDFQDISPDGRYLAFRSRDQTLHLLDLPSQRPEPPLPLDRAGLRAVRYFVFSPDSQLLAVVTARNGGGQDTRETEVFDLLTRTRILRVEGLSGQVVFASDSRHLAGVHQKEIRVWDVARRQLAHTLKVTGGTTTTLAFSPDGALLATGKVEGTAQLWELRTERLLRTLSGHKEGVGKLAFSQDGRTLFTGSTDDTVKLWHVATGQEMLTLADFAEDTWELQLSPDDVTLVVGRALASGTAPLRLYQAPLLSEIETAPSGAAVSR